MALCRFPLTLWKREEWRSSLSGFSSSAFYISIWQIIISGKRKMACIKSEKIQFQTSEEKAPSTYSFFGVSTRLITGEYCLSLRHDVPASSNSRSGCNFYVCLLLVCCLLAESCQEWVILQGSDLQSQSNPAQQPDRQAAIFLFYLWLKSHSSILVRCQPEQSDSS